MTLAHAATATAVHALVVFVHGRLGRIRLVGILILAVLIVVVVVVAVVVLFLVLVVVVVVVGVVWFVELLVVFEIASVVRLIHIHVAHHVRLVALLRRALGFQLCHRVRVATRSLGGARRRRRRRRSPLGFAGVRHNWHMRVVFLVVRYLRLDGHNARLNFVDAIRDREHTLLLLLLLAASRVAASRHDWVIFVG